MIANVPIESLPPEVRHRLGWYVDRLIDPRNSETFQARVSPQLGGPEQESQRTRPERQASLTLR